ncbi:phage terminase small subunit [Endozoicomonas sp. SCSIO W0465]|uniref:phage terminase small subunit n=1 Tax=Endozoicomonas sp. SCSIO W0465 TaxID=2918516 RepID=UPI002075084D|nr:phage terminase small subunit [Endozoicomonas sp. SCSIO W0465]USE39135.1 phage terminase small subunit [Endozoicomonas sp. SCSIO W0465]
MKAKQATAQQDKLAESYEAESIRQTAEDYEQFQLLVNALEQDQKKLSGLAPGDKDKLREKELIPKYLPIAEDYLASGDSYRNPILVEVIIMLMDVGNIPKALELAYPALEQKQPMPQRFKKVNLPTFVCDNVLVWANAELARGKEVEPWFSKTFETLLEDNWKVPREVVAKFHKVSGDIEMKNNRLEHALEHFVRATEIDPAGAKCSTKINQLRKKLDKQD